MYVVVFSFKKFTRYPCLTDLISNDRSTHLIYASHNLVWHCENIPLSASLQLREEIMNFSFRHPDSFLAARLPGITLYRFVPKFLQAIKTLVCPTLFVHLI